MELEFSIVTFEYFLMILVRIASFVFIAPFFGMSNTPRTVKIGLSVLVSVLVYQMVLPKNTLEYSGTLDYAFIVIKEGITGLLIGFAANICNSIVLLSGKIIDMEIGLAMAQVFDPINNSISGITSNIYNYFILMLLVISNMHHYILRAFIDSYQLIPIGETVFDWSHLLTGMVTFMGDLMVIGFRIVLPVFVCTMILNCILGVLSKVAPQMNMFSVGIQLKVLVGLGVIFLTIGLLPHISNFIFTEMKKMMVIFIEGMY